MKAQICAVFCLAFVMVGHAAATPYDETLRTRVIEEPEWEVIAEEIQYGDERAVTMVTHSEEEVMAQAMCQAIAVAKNLAGWTYAVERLCGYPKPTCIQICASPFLHNQDSQTASRTWSTIGAFHVYKNRPATTPGTNVSAKLGLKSYYSSTYHTSNGCGPNFCCCRAA